MNALLGHYSENLQKAQQERMGVSSDKKQLESEIDAHNETKEKVNDLEAQVSNARAMQDDYVRELETKLQKVLTDKKNDLQERKTKLGSLEKKLKDVQMQFDQKMLQHHAVVLLLT